MSPPMEPEMLEFIRGELDSALGELETTLRRDPTIQRVANSVRAFASTANLAELGWALSFAAAVEAALNRGALDPLALGLVVSELRVSTAAVADLAAGPDVTAAIAMVETMRTPAAESGPAEKPSAHRQASVPPPPMNAKHAATLLAAFREDAAVQLASLQEGVLALESNPTRPDLLEKVMRAAHSLKGAARVLNLRAMLDVAHALEDAFVSAQRGVAKFGQDELDVFLASVDALSACAAAAVANGGNVEDAELANLQRLVDPLRAIAEGRPHERLAPVAVAAPVSRDSGTDRVSDGADRVVRVSAEMADRILGLAGEAVVEAQRVAPAIGALTELRIKQLEIIDLARSLVGAARSAGVGEGVASLLAELAGNVSECQQLVTRSAVLLDEHARRGTDLAARLYDGVLVSRMRPLRDRTSGLPRMVRDLSRQLGKRVTYVTRGEETLVDRDVLERLEAPIGHLVRNSVDHGIEGPEQRVAAGKPENGTIALEATQARGAVRVELRDDGRGVDRARVIERARARGLLAASMAEKLRDEDILDLLFLPGFSTAREVTDVSGRGVGLDVVRRVLDELGGTVRITSTEGRGTSFVLEAPLTRSVLRCLLVRISDEVYALPLGRVDRVLRLGRDDVHALEGREYVVVDGRNIGVVRASDGLGLDASTRSGDGLAALVLSGADGQHALVVEAFLGEEDLVVRRLDARLQGVQHVMAASTLQDGTLVLIVDVDDLLRSVDVLLARGGQRAVASDVTVQPRKHVLVVDDSVTVREAERQLLTARGYLVSVAVDGAEAWNAVRTSKYDLVVTDIDMPRMNGIELVTAIKGDPHLAALPVVVVSYKDREEDRLRGLQAGADAYLKKGSFDDRALMEIVTNLIGGPER